MKATSRLRELLNRPEMLVAPGAHDAMTAKLVEAQGFDALYLGGYAGSASMLGIPDHSLITMTELLTQARNVTAAVEIPVVADIDDGGGAPLNVRRTVRLCERAGLAGVHIEDLVLGKHFLGHPDRLVSTQDAVQRIRAAVDARTDPDFVIIGRTDAISVNSLDDALERARAYAAAGADLLMLPGLRLDDSPAVAQALPAPLVNLAGPESRQDLERAGTKLAIYPGASLFVAYKAVRDMLHDLNQQGVIPNYRDRTCRMREFSAFIGMGDATQLAEQYGMV